MKRVITWPGSIPRALDLLYTNRHQMTALAAVCQDMFGTSTVATGFAATATSPASMSVSIAPGNLYGLLTLDATAYSSLSADTAHSIVKQAVVLDAQTLACPAPTTSGQSVSYLIQAVLSESDTDALVLPYYNSTTPSQPYSGANNSGAANYTTRACVATLTAKAGTAATTGSQAAPAPDSGAIGLWVVTVAYGATTITAANIAAYSASPLLTSSLLAMIQARAALAGNSAQQFSAAAATSATQVPQAGQLNGKNRVINGRFTVNSRSYASGTTAAVNTFTYDRWFSSTAGSSITKSGTTAVPITTISGSFKQVIEMAVIGAGNYVLSWSGTATARIYKSGATVPAYAASPVSFVSDGAANVIVEVSNGTCDYVQVESGSFPTTYDFRHPGVELALCQRYFVTISDFVTGWCNGANTVSLVLKFPVAMYTSPSIALVSVGTITDGSTSGSGASGLAISSENTTGARVNVTPSFTTTASRPAIAESFLYTATAEMIS